MSKKDKKKEEPKKKTDQEIHDNQKIVPIQIEEEMKTSYLNYAMSVIVGRALPDVRDGLKPVHRRILFSMRDLGLENSRTYKKSARIVGDCLGRFHPHGDTAVYDTLVRMAQDFSLRYPLIDGQGNFGCFTADTKIKLLDGRDLSFEELAEEFGSNDTFYVYSVDSAGHVTVGQGRNSRITRHGSRILQLILDTGEKIRCTPDHRFMLRDGSYKRAKDLTEKDSLMPGYFKTLPIKDGLNDYLAVRQPTTNKYEFVHRMVDRWMDKERRTRSIKGPFVRHHVNFNRFDNRPENLVRVRFLEHLHIHAEHLSELWSSNSFRVAQRKGVKSYYAENPGVLEERRRRFVRQNRSESFRKNNAIKVSRSLRMKHAQNPQLAQETGRRMRLLWEDPDYRARMSRALKGIEKRPLTNEQADRVKRIISEKSRAMWNSKKRGEIVKAIHLALGKPEVRKKISENSKRLWKDTAYRMKYGDEHFSRMSKAFWTLPHAKSLHRAKIARQREHPEFRRAQSEGVRSSNLRRIAADPLVMSKIARTAGRSLSELWKSPEYRNQVLRSRVLRFGASLLSKHSRKELTPDVYDNERQNTSCPRAKNLDKYFNGFEDMLDQAAHYNHKIVSKRYLSDRSDVWDITVEEHHNFLLSCGVFVHNSVDGDSAAAMRYCVTGDTRVVTDKGLVSIKDLSENGSEDVRLSVLSLDRKVNQASKWFDSGEHPTIRIETAGGFSLRGSYNHPILTWAVNKDSGQPEFQWKLLSKLSRGDVAVLDRTSDLLWPESDLPLTPYRPSGKSVDRCQTKVLPREMNEDLAFILGGLVAEGTVKEKEIEFCNSDPDWVKEFDARWQRVFPDCRLHRFTRKPNSFGKKPYETREIHSRFVIRFLRNVGLEPARSRQKTIPALVLRSTRPVAAAFLRAYFEGDGSITSSGKKMVELSCTSGSGRLIHEIQTLLLRFGIASTKRFDRYREIHKLYIRGLDNYRLFEKEIGFCSKRKQDKLREAVSSCHRDFSITDFVPHIGRFVREHLDPDLRWSGGKAFILKNNLDRYPKLEEHLPRAVAVLDRRTQPMTLELFQDLLFTRYLFDPIVQVQKSGIERVYSLKVESNCHSFVANGFINHNTEARLAPIASTLLRDIDKETVDFGPNFDETLEEPKLLPAILPNLLVNGAGGIAVGMATNIPPHNLGEVSDAILSLVDDPSLTVKDLMKFVKGPDFPTGASIVGASGIKSAYETGRGSIIIRSTAAIEELKGGREAIVVTAIPYQVNKSTLIETMANLVNNKKIEGIADIRDESDRKGMRIVVVLKRDAASQVILNQLFKHTQLQTSFGVILLALADGRPRVLNLKEILEHYISHRKEVILRRSRFDLEKAKDRAHILEGLKVALDNLDQIIKTIRKAKTPPIAKEALMNNFDLSERQAQAILEMQLQRLTGLEREKIDSEYKEVLKRIDELEEIIRSEKKVLAIIKTELTEVRDKFNNERRTEISRDSSSLDMEIEDLIADEDVVVTISHQGYVKRAPLTSFRKQKRGGTGVSGASSKLEEDFTEHLFIASTLDHLILFTSKGKAYSVRVHELPQGTRVSKGKFIKNFVSLNQGEAINSIVPIRKFEPNKYLTMVTESGTSKKTELSQFESIRKSGIAAINLRKGDELISVRLSGGNDNIFVATKQGKALHFPEKNLRPMGRSAAGVRGMKLKSNDVVVGMEVVDKKDTILTVTEKGFAKRTIVSEYRLQSRGGQGITNLKIAAKNGSAVGMRRVSDNDDLMVVSNKGMVVRIPVKDIRQTGRASQGVRVINLKAGDSVATMTVIEAEESLAEEGAPAAAEQK